MEQAYQDKYTHSLRNLSALWVAYCQTESPDTYHAFEQLQLLCYQSQVHYQEHNLRKAIDVLPNPIAHGRPC